MYLFVECAVLCLAMWGICFVCTGSDEKNLKSYRSYPEEVQSRLKKLQKYKDRIREANRKKVFLSNLALFMPILFVLGFIVKDGTFWGNFMHVLVVGQVLNLFDFLVIDLLWWRNTKRIRFTEIPEREAYQDPKKHADSFRLACVMYLIIAFADGAILTLI